MAEADKIPKIDPAEVDLLIEKFEQNKLSDQDKKVISGLLRTLLYLVAELQDKKAILNRLRMKKKRMRPAILTKAWRRIRREERETRSLRARQAARRSMATGGFPHRHIEALRRSTAVILNSPQAALVLTRNAGARFIRLFDRTASFSLLALP